MRKRKTNESLIADLESFKTPDAITSPQMIVFNAPSAVTFMIKSLQALFLTTSVKLQIILQKNKNDSILVHTLMRGEHLYWQLILMELNLISPISSIKLPQIHLNVNKIKLITQEMS